MNILGLDVSTSCTGLTILDEDMNIIKMDHIDFSKCDGIWEKVDFAKSTFEKLFSEYKIDKCFIEESLMSFSAGFSSAATILTLSKFNFALSYFVREYMKINPTHISAATARKTIGVKLLQKAKCGISHKEQVFNWLVVSGGPLSNIDFPKTRTGKFKPFVADECDSYVIARAGVILNR